MFRVNGERRSESNMANAYIQMAASISNIDVYFRGDKEKDPFQTDILILSGEEDEFMPPI